MHAEDVRMLWNVEHVPFVVLGLHVDGLVQDCCNSSALAVELLQSYAKPSMCTFVN